LLEPLLGQNGAVVAQYLITLIVVLALVVLVVWLVRRYALTGVAAGARGRMPRLAIVDALSLDSRNRLVLVRRDNVEHLLLIGGQTNVLVEPAIVRTRVAQKPAQPQPAPPPAPSPIRAASQPISPPPPQPPPSSSQPTLTRRQGPIIADEPIPFAPRTPRTMPPRAATARPMSRIPVRPVEAPPPREQRVEVDPEIEETIEEASFTEEALRIPRIADPTIVDEEPEPAVEPPPPPPRSLSADLRAAGESPSIFAPRYDGRGMDGALPPESEEESPGEPDRGPLGGPGPAAPKVTDLEKEMARLLGEISNGRA
jgi:flagellar biogenesis protein FliO